MRASVKRAIHGTVLAFGAPVGWPGLQIGAGHPMVGEVAGDIGLHLLVPTVVVFASFGAMLGLHEERLQRANLRLNEDALTDELTGLKNLRYFRARLEEECAISLRGTSPVGLLMIDLDRFKRVNDRYGHPEGDRLLKSVGLAITSVVRQGETAARVGGEEFALLLPGASGTEAAAAAGRVRGAVAAVQLHPSTAGPAISVTVSVGCASTTDLGPLTPDELYSSADSALYSAKRQGRDRAVLASARRAVSRIDS